MGALAIFDKLKSIFREGKKDEKKDEPPVALPEVFPFDSMDVETAPAPAHRPDHAKKNINHAGHMRVLARNDEEAKEVGAEALKLARDKKTILYGDDVVSAYISNFPYLKFLTVTRNSDTLCMFPFFNVGRPIDVRITEITECANGYEGQLETYAKGAALAFFDALYFKNKNRYFPGMEAKVLVSGIAYVLTKVRDEAGAEKKTFRNETVDSGYLAFHYENGDLDDYVFRGRVREVRDFSILGKKVQAIKVPLRIGVDSVLDIYVCATENAINERLQKGDYVSGIVWLQGFVV